MEPVFMILGQSAATAAVMSLDKNIALQDLPYKALREQLLKDGQVLELEMDEPVSTAFAIQLDGIVVDDSRAEIQGSWNHSVSRGPCFYRGYCHDGNGGKGSRRAKFTAKLKPGKYEVRLVWPQDANRATNVPVTVHHANGDKLITVNQRKVPPIDKAALSLGTFEFGETGSVSLSNKGTDGYVIADAVQFLKKE